MRPQSSCQEQGLLSSNPISPSKRGERTAFEYGDLSGVKGVKASFFGRRARESGARARDDVWIIEIAVGCKAESRKYFAVVEEFRVLAG